MQNKTKLTLILNKVDGKWCLDNFKLKDNAILLSTFINITENLLKPLIGKEIEKLNNLLKSNQKKYTQLTDNLLLDFKIKKPKNKKVKKLKLKGSAQDLEFFLNTITTKTVEEDIIDLFSEVLTLKYNISKEDTKKLIQFNYHNKDNSDSIYNLNFNPSNNETYNPYKDIDNEEAITLGSGCLFSVIHITQDIKDFLPVKEPEKVLTSKEILERIKNNHEKRNSLLKSLNRKSKDSNLSEK